MLGDLSPASAEVVGNTPPSVRVCRPSGEVGVVALHGRAESYRVEPNGEYYVGHIGMRGVDFVRGRSRYSVQPGELVIWDPSAPHRGASADGGIWEFRALVLELPSVAKIMVDPEDCVLDLEFPHPVIRATTRVASFLRLYSALTNPSSMLERDVSVVAWVRGLSPGAGQVTESRTMARRDPALRRACALLQDAPDSDVGLSELALAAGVSTFRLLRLFKAGLGVPPHRYQVQLRVQQARILLENGEPPTQVAHRVGFYDQSHLTRHFQRRMGMTPARYARACAPARRAGSTGLGPRLPA